MNGDVWTLLASDPVVWRAYENVVEDVARDDHPRRSEPADFGGGETTGVQNLLGGDDA